MRQGCKADTGRADMTDLIARLAAATAGSRELDVRIKAWLQPDIPVMTDSGGYGPNAHPVEYTALSEMIEVWADGAPNDDRARDHHWDGLGMGVSTPHYTTSIDAALTLVPEGWSIANFYEAVKPQDRPWWGVVLRRDEPYRVFESLGHPTPALALTIAALKARAT